MAIQSIAKMQTFYSIVGCVNSILGELNLKDARGDKPAMAAYHVQKIKENVIAIYKALTKDYTNEEIKKCIPAISKDNGFTRIQLVDKEKKLIEVLIHYTGVEIVTNTISYKFTMPFVSAE